MTPSMIRALVFFLASQTFVLAAGFVLFAMIGEVNRKIADEQRMSYLFGHFGKYRTIFREYRRLYPDGRLAVYCYVLSFIALGLFLVSAWEFGIL